MNSLSLGCQVDAGGTLENVIPGLEPLMLLVGLTIAGERILEPPLLPVQLVGAILSLGSETDGQQASVHPQHASDAVDELL